MSELWLVDILLVSRRLSIWRGCIDFIFLEIFKSFYKMFVFI